MIANSEISSRVNRFPVQWQTEIDLPATTMAPSAARRVTKTLLALWGLTDLCEDAELIVTELLTNALQHAPGRGFLQLALKGETDGVVIGVPDTSPAIPLIRTFAPALDDGRGMRLIEQIATEWGAEPYQDGKLVWARLQRAR